MPAALWFCIALLGADAALSAWLLVCRLRDPLSAAPFGEMAFFAGFAGALVAMIGLQISLRRGRSEDLLKASQDLLEKAHEALLDTNKKITNNRHSWLTAARLIATAEALSSDLTEESHATIYRGTRRCWSARIHDLIFPAPPDGLPETFYADSPEHFNFWSGDQRAPLSEKSLAYLYRFIGWRTSEGDPIATVEFTDEEVEEMRTRGPIGLGQLLTKARAPKSGRDHG